MISSPAGNDILFDESALEQGRNFNNKLWNALKLVKSWESRIALTAHQSSSFATDWFHARLQKAKAEVETLMQQFRLSEALKTLYSLIWDDFCSWYLEWAKPGFEQPVDADVYAKTIGYFEEMMQLLHPFMPFITEEIYQLLRKQETDICIKQQTVTQPADNGILAAGELLKQVISALRDARNKNQIKPKDPIKLHIETENKVSYTAITNILAKQVNAEQIDFITSELGKTIVVAVEKDRFFIESNQHLDSTTLKTELLKDLDYQLKFRESVQKKLSNERFVQNAKPEVIELERKKLADADARIHNIKESLKNL